MGSGALPTSIGGALENHSAGAANERIAFDAIIAGLSGVVPPIAGRYDASIAKCADHGRGRAHGEQLAKLPELLTLGFAGSRCAYELAASC